MKVEDENAFPCPFCDKNWIVVIKDWANLHTKEELIHCTDCDRIYLLKYELVKFVELVEKEINDLVLDKYRGD